MAKRAVVEWSQLEPLPYVESRDPRVRVWIRTEAGFPIRDKAGVVSYLTSATCLAARPLIQRDHLREGELIDVPPHLMTDGSWLWIQTLAYWVERYDVRIPDEFVRHARSLDFTPPSVTSPTGEERESIPIYDGTRDGDEFFVPPGLRNQ